MKKIQILLIFLTLSILFLNSSFAQSPVANFSADRTKGCGTTLVTFTDLSTNMPTSWLWDFGDGTATSNIQNPAHAFTVSGTFTVTLIATNGSGSDTVTNEIVIFTAPIAGFNADIFTGCTPTSINFADTTILGSAPIQSRQWDFGDGTGDTSTNPSHTYITGGAYQISLSITDTNGCMDNLIKNSYININETPIASYSASPIIACKPPLTTTFNNTSTGTGLTYIWDFGDGNSSTDSIPTNSYPTSGSYITSLIVNSSNGCSDTTFQTLPAQVGPFTTKFGSNITHGCPPLTVVFSDSTVDAIAWEWSFGDDSTSTEINPSHQYLNSGSFPVTLITTNANGCKDTLITNNYISILPKTVVDFTADNTTDCLAPFNVNFTDNTIGALSWNWSFGDGTTSNLQNPSKTYLTYGTDTVQLTITDGNGCSSTLSKPNFIKVLQPKADFDALPSQGCHPFSTNLINTSITANPIISWEYTFEDGTTSNLENPPFLSPDTGSFAVKLIIVDSKGCSDTITKPNFIKAGLKPTLSFSGSPLSGCHPLSAQFASTYSSYTNMWRWDFGDNGKSILANPLHVYADTGLFTVTLAVGHNGCFDSLVKTDYITVLPPKPQFSATPQTNCTSPSFTQFNDLSASAETWFWDFGDGNTSTLQNPTHTYTSGQYTVKLVVTNSNGCTDSVTNTKFIQISGFNTGFTQSKTQTCLKNKVIFTDTSYSAIPLKSRKWDFGDGTIKTVTNSDTISHIYTATGIYSVKLVITDLINCKDSVTINNFTEILPLPIPSFTADTTKGCSHLTVVFDPLLSTIAAPDSITQWIWTYGDTKKDTLTTPVATPHIYEKRGIYTVSLKTKTALGCESTLQKLNYIRASHPYPTFTTKAITCFNDSVYFNNTTSDIAGVACTWSWNFDDGTTSKVVRPYHKYTVDTTTVFNVTLSVTDAYGCDSIITKPINISRPIPTFSAVDPFALCPPLFLPFINESSADVTTWSWKFGDPSSGGNNASTQANPQHVFQNSGTYPITLSVKNGSGCIDSLIKPNFVTVHGPVGTFSFTPLNGCSPQNIHFTASAIETDSYTWVFGDGNSITTTEDTVTYQYVTSGNYTPVLLLKNFTNAPGDTCVKSVISPQNLLINFADVQFSVVDSFACNPTNFLFNDNSIVYPTTDSCTWHFGDGTSQTIVYPATYPLSHNYTADGKYDVTLEIFVNGCSYSLEKKDFITVFTPPLLRFGLSDTAGCPPLSTNFFVIDSTYADSVSSWSWNFDDGGSLDTNKNPSRIFTTSNIYNITLTANFLNGCTEVFSQPTNLTVFPHAVALFAPGNIITCFNDSLIFNNSSTGTNPTYLWSFGDGASSTSTNPYHKYTVDTTTVFNVSLTTYDDYGCDSTITQSITISRPIPLFSAVNPSALCPPLYLPFNNESSADVINWSWNFGDSISGTSDTSTLANPDHQFDNPGTYSISLSVQNTDGCIDSLTIPNYVTVHGPVGTFSFTPLTGCAPQNVHFTATATETDSYTWVFGDGNSTTTTEDTITYQYISGGNYTPILLLNNLTNSPGDTCIRSAISSQNLFINSAEVAFSVVDSFACNPTSFQFNENSIIYPAIDSCTWNYGDGTSQTMVYPITYPISHTYTADGKYDVKLDVFINGCTFSLVKPNFVTVFTPPLVKFGVTDTASCFPLSTNFYVIDSTYSADPVSNWSWNFDDGGLSDDNKNPSRVFNASKNYNIALTANFVNGCTEIYPQPTNLTVYPLPIAQFTTDTNYLFAGDYLSFTDHSTGIITSWNWNFGDGNTSTMVNPKHEYDYFGTYQTTLLVTTNHGCIDTTSKTIIIIEKTEIPNAFTPDGDGINDVFMEGADLTIINRWGQTLYQGLKGWDGTYNDTPALPGTYFYILTVNDIKDHPKKFQGSVTLIRK